jgi:hypothetical protein
VVVVDRNTLHAAKQVGAMLIFNTIIRVSGGADYGMKQNNPDIRNIQRGPIHRHLHCHPSAPVDSRHPNEKVKNIIAF